jgi:hypothetical protein
MFDSIKRNEQGQVEVTVVFADGSEYNLAVFDIEDHGDFIVVNMIDGCIAFMKAQLRSLIFMNPEGE